MRKCILLFTIATLLAASFCSSDEWVDGDDNGCAPEGDRDNILTTREACNKRKATDSEYDCCLFSGTILGEMTKSCIAAKKSKAGKIVDEVKEQSNGTAKITLLCESSMIKYFTLFSLLSLFLF